MGLAQFERDRNNILNLAVTRINARISEANAQRWDEQQKLKRLSAPKKLEEAFAAYILGVKASKKTRIDARKAYDKVIKGLDAQDKAQAKKLDSVVSNTGFKSATVYKSGKAPKHAIVESDEHLRQRQIAAAKPLNTKIEKLEELRQSTKEKFTLCGSAADLKLMFEELVKELG